MFTGSLPIRSSPATVEAQVDRACAAVCRAGPVGANGGGTLCAAARNLDRACAGGSRSAVGVWEIEPERCTESGDVVTVDVSDWIAGVPAHSPLRSFAADRCASDAPLTLESSRREDVRVGHAAVVDRLIGQWLVKVKINTSGRTIVQDEIPRSVVAPGQNPVDTTCGEDHVSCANSLAGSHRSRSEWSRVCWPSRASTPQPPTDAGVSSLSLERLDEVDRLPSHDVLAHGFAP